MALKLVIIGGGSSYTPEIIEGILNRYNDFPVTDITLTDIEAGAEKLNIVSSLVWRMIQKSNRPINLTSTLDRQKALENADFVTTQIRVGGLDAREKDERIPLSHGYIGQETNGAGGIFKALRTIPVLIDIAEDVHNICPNAWIINFTNPAGIVTEAVLKYSSHKQVIGVYNIPFNMRHSVAEILDFSPQSIEIEFVGLNHFVFGKKVYADGVDQTENVLKKLAHGKLNYSPANIINLGWSKYFIEAINILPNPYHQYYFQTQSVLQNDLQAFKEKGTRAEAVKDIEKSLFDLYKDSNLDEKPSELEDRGGAFYSDVACSLMNSIYNNTGDVQTVNTLNRGAIPDLPYDSVIEVNSVISKYGPRPISSGALPLSIKGHILRMKAFEDLIIKAAIDGSHKHVYQSMLMNPLVGDEKGAKILLDELMEAHKDYLPQFKFNE